MFTLEFKILWEEEKELKEYSVEEFDKECGQIEGQIELHFGEYKWGYIVNDEGLTDFPGELLDWWFDQLNECCNILKTGDYACFYLPDTADYWLEMRVVDDDIHVQLSELVKRTKNENGYVYDKPLKGFQYDRWKDTVIKKSEFINVVEASTTRFVEEIRKLNPELLKSKSLGRYSWLNSIMSQEN